MNQAELKRVPIAGVDKHRTSVLEPELLHVHVWVSHAHTTELIKEVL
jgi:hypothetical protein